eukprot:TRINITY_DN12523_c0_g1_i1.p2 TRINITY_DN12523_c0_g1~~TRINITY_DN12523_c0_g1_i1.p2  ORF type:complete len:126 (+),score=19.31 TRINITY_DN12523_c0_g1_i1:191-568(+)
MKCVIMGHARGTILRHPCSRLSATLTPCLQKQSHSASTNILPHTQVKFPIGVNFEGDIAGDAGAIETSHSVGAGGVDRTHMLTPVTFIDVFTGSSGIAVCEPPVTEAMKLFFPLHQLSAACTGGT